MRKYILDKKIACVDAQAETKNPRRKLINMKNSLTLETSQEDRDRKRLNVEGIKAICDVEPIIKSSAEWKKAQQTIRPLLKASDSLNLSIWGEARVFNVLAKGVRETLYLSTKKKEANKKAPLINKTFQRIFETEEGLTVVIDGPILCQKDADVLSAIISIYFEKGYADGLVEYTAALVAERLGYLSASGKILKDIKGSIIRLGIVTILVYKGEDPHIVGRILDFPNSQIPKGRKGSYLSKLNGSFVDPFIKENFSIQKFSQLFPLPQLAKFLYKRVVEEDKPLLVIELPKLWGAIKMCDGKAWESLTPKEKTFFRTDVKRALKKLVLSRICTKESNYKMDKISLFYSKVERNIAEPSL